MNYKHNQPSTAGCAEKLLAINIQLPLYMYILLHQTTNNDGIWIDCVQWRNLILFSGAASSIAKRAPPLEKQLYKNDLQIVRVVDANPGTSRAMAAPGSRPSTVSAPSVAKIVKREAQVSALPFTSQQMSMISNSLNTKIEKTEQLANGMCKWGIDSAEY